MHNINYSHISLNQAANARNNHSILWDLSLHFKNIISATVLHLLSKKNYAYVPTNCLYLAFVSLPTITHTTNSNIWTFNLKYNNSQLQTPNKQSQTTEQTL